MRYCFRLNNNLLILAFFLHNTITIKSQIIFSNTKNREVFKREKVQNIIIKKDTIPAMLAKKDTIKLDTLNSKKQKARNIYLAEIPSIYPLFLKNGIIISSAFNYRLHPISKKIKFHNGIDIPANEKDNVYATADGEVIEIYSNKNNGLGYGIKVKHKNNYQTVYGHLYFLPNLKIGDTVERGQIIGKVGSTGSSTGNHLHYTIYYKNKAINPMVYCKLMK